MRADTGMRAAAGRRLRAASMSAALGALLLVLAGSAGAQPMTGMPGMHGMEWGRESLLLAEVLEYAPGAIERPLRYDLLGWYGGASHRLFAKAEGEQSTQAGSGEAELQLLYGRLIAPYWDAQIGVRVDADYGTGSTDTRVALALGVQGLAPGWFEVEPTLFVSQDGDISASFKASYDLLFTQRLVLQPRVETNAAVQAVPELGVGSGFNNVELGMRMRYEIRRELAPYVGFSWERQLGETANLARTSGEPLRGFSVVAGIRLWR